MKKKIYIIQPTYRDQNGKLLKGNKLYTISLALPALSSIIPADWEKEFCYEYLEEINFNSDASVIGISSMGYEIFRGIEIAEKFREKGKKIIFGGFQPHISKDFVEPHCDSIVHGNPGIKDMSGILKDVEQNSLKKEYFCITDLNYKIDYTTLDLNKIMFTPVILSVGCKNTCDYCCIGSIYQGMYRLRNFNDLSEELDYLHKRTRKIAFIDTNFYNNRLYLQKVCKLMIERNYNFIWGGQCTIDIGDDIETLNLLKKAGCRILFIGMETIEQKNLDQVNKKYEVNTYIQKIRNINNAGIKIAAFFIYGMDNDTKDTGSFLSKFIIKNRIALPMLNILVPTPGTKLYDELKNDNRILMEDEQDFLKNNPAYNSSFNLCYYLPKNLTREEVELGFIEILKRLSGYYQILRRSITKDISLSIYLLYMNWLFRKEYLALKERTLNN